MELKDCIVTRIHQACDAKKIPHASRYRELAEAYCGSPHKVDRVMVAHWMQGITCIHDYMIKPLADFLGVNERWLFEGTGARYPERIGLNGNEVNWVVEQKKLYNFDHGEMKDKALAWLLMHMPVEVVNEFCSPENGHDARTMRIDIRVNDVELPVKRFEDLITNLSDAMLSYKCRLLGLDSLEKSAFTQAEAILRKLHGDTYDKLGEVMNQLDNMKDNLGTLNELAWSAYSSEALHVIGAFTVQLPPHPEHYFDEEKHGKSNRQHAIELFVRMVNGARAHLLRHGMRVSDLPKDHERLDKLARSIFHDLTEQEQVYCELHLAMSDFNKELQ